MIQVQISLSKEGQEVKEIEMTGHAGYGEHGQDIVCAAVSSQVISVENSLYQLLQVPVETTVNEMEGGYLKLVLPWIEQKKLKHDVQLLMRHLILALEVTEQAYPEYIQIKQTIL
ncbi:ribosomal-processing cysteine protease Prp [Facklamia sp. P12950]|uniref:ribosomal-processing cysteine protease Prp n=1 Tax=Facklamia sp. P12950 TaxID=3421951 RepID=UPI003D1836F5